MPKTTTENHSDAALACIKLVRALPLTPPEQIMVLSTAADMLDNELSAVSLAMVLKQALTPEH